METKTKGNLSAKFVYHFPENFSDLQVMKKKVRKIQFIQTNKIPVNVVFLEEGISEPTVVYEEKVVVIYSKEEAKDFIEKRTIIYSDQLNSKKVVNDLGSVFENLKSVYESFLKKFF